MSRKAERELADLQSTMEQRVIEKVRLIQRAERVAPGASFNAAWSDGKIRARAVCEAMGPAAIDGRSDDYIEARFDHLAEQRPVDPVRLALMQRASRPH